MSTAENKHLALVDINEVATRKEKVALRHREDRVNIPLDVLTDVSITFSSGETISGRLSDISSFGARVKIDSTIPLIRSNEFIALKIKINSKTIFEGKAVVVNELLSGHSSSISLSITSGMVDKDQVRAVLIDGERIPKLSKTKALLNLVGQVKPEFKILLSDLMTFFSDIKETLETEDKVISEQALNDNHRLRLEQQTIEMALSLYGADLQAIFDKFQSVVENFSKEEEALHKQYFRINFGRAVVAETPFMNRAFEKPLGYAGDFGLMIMFYEYQDLGKTLFYKFMHRLACNQPAAVANKNRVHYLADLMQSIYDLKTAGKKDANIFKISTIACGPARESQLFLEQTSFEENTTIEMTLLDQEPLALDKAIHSLKRVGNSKCNLKVNAFEEDAVLGTIKKKPFTKELNNSNLIISAGLFDYLSDRVSTKLIDSLFEYVLPGGELIIGNVSDKNPDRFSMNYFMEWNLILRSPEALQALVSEELRQKYKPEIEVVSESLGLNLFLRVKKPK